jgi:tetratricopeptide (TPR) repeat protein
LNGNESLKAAIAHLRAGAPSAALDSLREGRARWPKDAALAVWEAYAWLHLGRRAEALGAMEGALCLEPRSPALDNMLGELFGACDEPGKAAHLFRRAVQGRPQDLGFRLNLAKAQRMMGEFKAAEDNLDILISADPLRFEAYMLRSDLRAARAEDNHVEALSRLVHGALGEDPRRTPVWFALAKELEDLGQWDAAFAALKRGCSAHRRTYAYDVASDIAVIDRLKAAYTKSAVTAGPAGFASPEPIFVVGLPRSGTTLVERIVSSHDAVFNAGELQDFDRVCAEGVLKLHPAARTPEAVLETALALDPESLGRAYVEATRPRTGHKPRFVDKLNWNYLNLGLIARALPAARMICLRRNPMDSCLSMYKVLFAERYLFSYDLDELGRYYAAWLGLIEHWRSVCGERLLIVDYEALVADPEAASRQILAHCALPWDPACLDFHRRDDPSTTASAVQVRQPIHQRSVDRWRRFERHLEPLADRLRRQGVPLS